MGKFVFNTTEIEGVYIIEPTIYGDDRGYFMETYNTRFFVDFGINTTFLQDNESCSKKGVLRGLHFQKNKQQAKLVRVTQGEIFDVCVDIRINSPTYGKWIGEILSSQNRKQLYIPKGFAHGFLVLSDMAVLNYKCSDFYDPMDEGGFLWNSFGIKWPNCGAELILSSKDQKWEKFK